ncbi:tannase/feruloyl esterase family alpha/beta hydrolase [Campylobacter concisus]|uniref:tannase/feruloyl esterase family alpha/beta hydrolase n=1 Tax=Campylobacter concisus TaxID=199 RepID=UPI0021563BEB|nr:tannase/feruloyl esterase family alpha/beta hydrolase [Campylobacter concisus]
MWSESGNGIDDVGPLEAWHEKGEAPKSMLAKSKTYAGKEFLVCAYPKVATYVGGDASKACSFVCK